MDIPNTIEDMINAQSLLLIYPYYPDLRCCHATIKIATITNCPTSKPILKANKGSKYGRFLFLITDLR
jgi:hypothetical protein